MAVSLLTQEVSDLCLGKPALRCLSVSASIGDALSALKRLRQTYLSVWTCNHDHDPDASFSSTSNSKSDDCVCIGKICMVDIICFLCRQDCLKSPTTALHSPLSVLIPRSPAGLVTHLEPHASLVEAIDLMLEGAQNLVIPIQSRRNTTGSRKKLLLHNKPSSNSTLHNNREYCWLAQEDLIRYLLNFIGLFNPTPINPINTLNVIETENILAIQYDSPALAALPLISLSLINHTSVAIVDADGKLIGEISPFTLNSCDETVSAAIATLSAGDLMAYIDCGGPPEELVQIVKDRLEERNLGAFLELMEEESIITSSSDDEFGGSGSHGRSGRLGGYSARLGRRSEAIVCYPWSSLVAVMIQALAHRVSYVWVVEEDGSLAGIVTFVGMLKVFRERMKSMI